MVTALVLGGGFLFIQSGDAATTAAAGATSSAPPDDAADTAAADAGPAPGVPQHDFPEVSGDPSIVRAGTKLQTLFEGGCVLTTGPAADRRGNVYFAELSARNVCKDEDGNVEAGIIWKYDGRNGRTTIWRSPSGQANGMDFDAEGNLVIGESADNGGQRVTKTDMRTGRSVILAAYYEGRKLNAPNGVSIDEQGRIYFTDPRYEGLEPVEQPVQGVYRIDTDGSVHRIIANATKPNGVYVAPDQSTLYVADFDTGFLDGPRLVPGGARVDPAAADDAVGVPAQPRRNGRRAAGVGQLPAEVRPRRDHRRLQRQPVRRRARQRRRRHPGVHPAGPGDRPHPDRGHPADRGGVRHRTELEHPVRHRRKGALPYPAERHRISTAPKLTGIPRGARTVRQRRGGHRTPMIAAVPAHSIPPASTAGSPP